jgi:hypothetical protein
MSNINQTHGNVKGKVTRCWPEQAQIVERVIFFTFRDLYTRRGWVVSITPQPLYPWKDQVPIVQKAG